MLISPLRYPGGKAKLYPFFVDLINSNQLFTANYYEPYAGGAGLALSLLSNGFVKNIHLNDIDPAIWAFWHSVLHETEGLCTLIEKTPVTINEWHKQKSVWVDCNKNSPLRLGFATYFLNRTNRSGIIDGAGPIGGFQQTGTWKIDARFNKQQQIENIRRISLLSNKISLSNQDALHFVDASFKDTDAFLYLDPPYYVKGRNLYKNFYTHNDHVLIEALLRKHTKKKWVVSYDDVPEIRTIYKSFTPFSYQLNYSAGRKTTGNEVIYVSRSLDCPQQIRPHQKAA